MNRILPAMLLIALAAPLPGCTRKRYTVPTGAMEPTIPSGSTVLVDHGAFRSSDPARWEVVSFEPPKSLYPPGASSSLPEQVWIMRVIGLPGEEVAFGGEEILIEGNPLVVPSRLKGISYVGLAKLGAGSRDGMTEILLGEDQYFVVGDNTTNSNDSRFWGPIHRSSISGKLDSP